MKLGIGPQWNALFVNSVMMSLGACWEQASTGTHEPKSFCV